MNELMYNNRDGRGTLTDFDRFLQHMLSPFDDFAPELMGMDCGSPRMEIAADEKNVTAKLPLPGYRNDDISVEVVGNQLTVSACREECPKDAKGRYLRRERTCSSYTETVRLPASVRGGEACAAYKDGILTVTMPRETDAAVSHTVTVQ